jgi:hypothetical protein
MKIPEFNPRLRGKVMLLITKLEDRGRDPIVYESVRTHERQQYLYGFGRSYDDPGDPRGIVTYSQDGDDSWHFYGLAVDIISKSKGWGAPPSFWVDLGQAARSVGLHWGGDWRKKDLPHVQWGEPMRDSPSPNAARLFASGGREAVWKVVGAG